MAVTVYRSTDASAPTLSGTKGDLTNLLHKCLVVGYGTQSGAGWTSSFTGTNVEVYRQGAGSQFYLRVDDNGTSDVTNGVREGLARGWEVKADANDVVDGLNTGPFPTIGQITLGTFIRKSSLGSNATPDATTRKWNLVADNKTFYLMVQTGDVASTYRGFGFGDIVSFYTAADAYKCFISGNESFALATTSDRFPSIRNNGLTDGALAGMYLARTYLQTGASLAAGKIGDGGKMPSAREANIGMVGNLPTPNAADGGIYLSPIYVYEGTSGNIRGYLRGLWHNLHTNASWTDEDTFTGNTGAYSGRSFIVFKPTPLYTDGSAATFPGNLTVETTAWDT